MESKIQIIIVIILAVVLFGVIVWKARKLSKSIKWKKKKIPI